VSDMTSTTDPSSDRPVFGTVGLYEQLATKLNNDATWRELAKPITYTMVFNYTAPIDRCFFLRFEEGEITEVDDISSPEANGPVDFVITAKPDVYAALIKGEMQPTAAMATGKARVKGKQTVLLRHMKRFGYLLDSMCKMDPVFAE
jgi:putative sterol carrier protein